MPKTIFTLGSGRSGTGFLAEFFKRNIIDCRSNHETMWDFGNPGMFGLPIYFRCHEDWQSLRPYLAKKARRILNYKEAWYFEANHAFLKSMDLLAHEYFPDLYLIRSIRDPFSFAKSAANREAAIHKIRIPVRHYSIGGQKFFTWSLTGQESIFKPFQKLSRYQFYLLEWLEVEMRAEAFLDRRNLHNRCFTVRCPEDFTADKFRELAAFFDLRTKRDVLDLDLDTNQTRLVPKTVVGNRDLEEAREVFGNVSNEYLNVYKKLFPAYDPIGAFSTPRPQQINLPEPAKAC